MKSNHPIIILRTTDEEKIFNCAASGVPLLPWDDEVADDLNVINVPSKERVAEIVAAAAGMAVPVCSWKQAQAPDHT